MAFKWSKYFASATMYQTPFSRPERRVFGIRSSEKWRLALGWE
jgi:hypothetical protein